MTERDLPLNQSISRRLLLCDLTGSSCGDLPEEGESFPFKLENKKLDLPELQVSFIEHHYAKASGGNARMLYLLSTKRKWRNTYSR